MEKKQVKQLVKREKSPSSSMSESLSSNPFKDNIVQPIVEIQVANFDSFIDVQKEQVKS